MAKLSRPAAGMLFLHGFTLRRWSLAAHKGCLTTTPLIWTYFLICHPPVASGMQSISGE